MKVSEQWLRQWINPKVNSEQLVHQLTMSGLEVDAVESAALDFTGVIVGHIQSVEKHPNADKLRVCQVSDGKNIVQVVCGAPNVVTDMKVPFAQVGAKLGGLKIRKAKLRGVESFGMLCSAVELGIGEDNSGLMALEADAPVGESIRTYLDLDDQIIDIDFTPNRGDCLSVAGLARELKGSFPDQPLHPVEFQPAPILIDEQFPIELKAQQACPLYLGRVIKKINRQAKTPLWMQEKLRRSGVRSINAIVDITNYVMLELGQPMHTFDLQKLSGAIEVRYAKSGESLVLLDNEQKVDLTEQTLVIADKAGPVAIAGVMGGQNTCVDEATHDIFLETAFFQPKAIIGKARHYGLHTESSYRFERGVDYRLPKKAMERVTQLIVEICQGQAGPINEVLVENKLPNVSDIQLKRHYLPERLGFVVEDKQVETILCALGFKVKAKSEGWQVSVPSWRFDVSIAMDLLEEIARIYGYDRLPYKAPAVTLAKPKAVTNLSKKIDALCEELASYGYSEAINYSFISPQLQKQFEPDLNPIMLANPIARDMSVMRTSLLPGLISNILYNQNRQQSRVKLFETGQTFLVKNVNDIEQNEMLAGVCMGSRYPQGWSNSRQMLDFFDCKGDLEKLFSSFSNKNFLTYRKADHSAMHPGQCAAIYTMTDQIVGYIGALHPQLQKEIGIKQPVYCFEIDPSYLFSEERDGYQVLSRFPSVRRDLALIVDSGLEALALTDFIKEQKETYLEDICLFDFYNGEELGEDKKSLAFSLTLRHPTRTLEEHEVMQIFERILAKLKREFSLSLR